MLPLEEGSAQVAGNNYNPNAGQDFVLGLRGWSGLLCKPHRLALVLALHALCEAHVSAANQSLIGAREMASQLSRPRGMRDNLCRHSKRKHENIATGNADGKSAVARIPVNEI